MHVRELCFSCCQHFGDVLWLLSGPHAAHLLSRPRHIPGAEVRFRTGASSWPSVYGDLGTNFVS